MSARQVSLVAFILTIAATIAVIVIRAITDIDSVMSSQTMVLAFPVFMAMMTRKSGRYPRVGATVALVAAGLALGALYLAIGK